MADSGRSSEDEDASESQVATEGQADEVLHVKKEASEDWPRSWAYNPLVRNCSYYTHGNLWEADIIHLAEKMLHHWNIKIGINIKH